MTKRFSFPFLLTILLCAPAAAAPAVSVELGIKVIHAHNRSSGKDARLTQLMAEMPKLSYSGYDLKDEAIFHLELASSGRMQLPNGEWMVIRPQEVAADGKLRLELSIKKLKFKSVVSVAPGATIAVGGPPFEEGALILAITRPK